MDEQGINKEYLDAVGPRLLDFDQTRLESMDQAGIDYIVNSLTCPGIEGILDKKEAQEAATACNDFLAGKIKAHPDRFGGFASVAMHDPEVGAPPNWNAASPNSASRGCCSTGTPSTAGTTTWSTSTTPATPRCGRR